MSSITQENRQVCIDSPLGENQLLVQHVSGTETLSRGFSYEVSVASEDDQISPETLVGQRVAVKYHSEDQQQRVINGMVRRFECTEQIEVPQKLTSYQLTLVPWFSLLQHNRDCRIFQDQSVPEIIKSVLQDRGSNEFEMRLSASYEPREYCVQYRESDFDFVSRLMEEEGIFYYYQHDATEHRLILCDSTNGYFDLPDSPLSYGPIGQSHLAQIQGWRRVTEFCPGSVAQRDFDFKQPTMDLETQRQGLSRFSGASELEVFDYPGRYTTHSDGQRLSQIRMEEAETGHDLVIASGACSSMTPGGKFSIEEHTSPQEIGQTYVVVETFTEFHSNLGFGETETDFRNQFQCIPARQVFRPQRTTPKPVVDGPQTAMVVTDGQEIVVDEHARVKVQFHWDRYGQQDINSSCWIRVSQIHAGQGWGMIDIPRRNEEVIVSFLNGDPDRPIITGRVYNGQNPPPFDLKGAGNNSTNKTRRGNTTRSYEAGGFNEFTMDDTAGEEQIRLHAQHNLDSTVEHDQSLIVHHDRTKTVDHDETNTIGNHRRTTVRDADDSLVLEKGSRSVEIRTGDHQTTVKQNHSLTVKSGNAASVVETGNHSMEAKQQVVITGHDKLIATGTNEVSVSGKKIAVTATKELSLGVGTNSIVINQQGISIGGVKITSAAVGVHEISGALIKVN